MGNVESRPEGGGTAMGTWHAKALPATVATAGQLEAVKSLIESRTLQNVVNLDKPLISLAATDDLHECFNRLVEYGLHGAPVYDEVEVDNGLGGRHKVKKWIGLLDWRDFVHYVVGFIDGTNASSLVDQSARSLAIDHPMMPVFEDVSLLSLLAGFGQHGVRRRPVVAKDEHGERILGMVSQLDVIRWLSQQRKELAPAFSSLSIEHVVAKEQTDPRFSKLRQVCSVMRDTLMSDVLRLLDQSSLNGVSGTCLPDHETKDSYVAYGDVRFGRTFGAVVDHEGKLVANISVSDLQYVVERDLDNLFTTVERFLTRVPRRPLITCPPTATLMEVIDKLAQSGVHRIYVINQDEEPMAVITLTDVINAVMLLATHDPGLLTTTGTSAM